MIDFIVKSFSRRSPGTGVHFTGFVENFQFVSILKSEEVHILEFSGGDRAPLYLFSGKDRNVSTTSTKSRRLQCKGYALVSIATRRS